jgi:hypothetical protein
LAGAGGGRAQGFVAGVVLAESVGVAVQGEDDGSVQEPVEQGGATVLSPRISPQATPRLLVITIEVFK